jgi:16S rRNA (guanine527-N7)-methyltransferase
VEGVALIQKYFPDLTEAQLNKFELLGKLYPEWNDRINVISRKDINTLYERHILHSLGIAKFTSFKAGTHMLDVGTGGGFPGIPLAIMFPDCEFLLVDSIAKKIKVVSEISTELGLNNVKTESQRAEKIRGEFDFVVSRAVTRMINFIPWVEKNIAASNQNSIDNGIIALKGGDLTDEMNEIRMPYQLQSLSDYFEEEFFETKKVVYIPF